MFPVSVWPQLLPFDSKSRTTVPLSFSVPWCLSPFPPGSPSAQPWASFLPGLTSTSPAFPCTYLPRQPSCPSELAAPAVPSCPTPLVLWSEVFARPWLEQTTCSYYLNPASSIPLPLPLFFFLLHHPLPILFAQPKNRHFKASAVPCSAGFADLSEALLR